MSRVQNNTHMCVCGHRRSDHLLRKAMDGFSNRNDGQTLKCTRCECANFGEDNTLEPVDRSCQTLTSGAPVPEDRSHTEIKENGQQKDYVVLCDAERAKGFVRPYRDAYKHLKCGTITTMGRKIAETYARDPTFYSGTFCCHCGDHFRIGEDGEFVWLENDGSIGPKVGT